MHQKFTALQLQASPGVICSWYMSALPWAKAGRNLGESWAKAFAESAAEQSIGLSSIQGASDAALYAALQVLTC